MTVNELVERYLKTRTGVRPNTLMNYGFVKNILAKEEFGSRKMSQVKTSESKNRNVLDVRASLKVGLQMEQDKFPSH